MSESQEFDDDAVQALRAAAATYREAKAAVDEYGRDRLEELRGTSRNARNLLLEYEDRATDTGAEGFVKFAQFKTNFVRLVENVDEELPAREAFERAREAVDKRRLSPEDFERAREELEPAADLVERLEELSTARDQLADARQRAIERRDELEAEIEERERILELGEADLDAPIEELREPIEHYDRAVREAFDELRSDASAREVFELIERTRAFPLVTLPQPPEDLREYVEETDAGDESIATLLEYADYSRSKLSHYVTDADALKRNVATRRTYLTELDAEGLTVGWPPPPAEHVPWLTRELRAISGRIVDEDALEALRELEAIARAPERYERLRDAAVADDQLSAEARERLESGAVEREIEQLRETIATIEGALEAAPDP